MTSHKVYIGYTPTSSENDMQSLDTSLANHFGTTNYVVDGMDLLSLTCFCNGKWWDVFFTTRNELSLVVEAV